MKYKLFTRLAALALLVAAGCGGSDHGTAKKPDPPARVSHPVEEQSLTTITLTPQAEERLGLSTSPLERKAIPRTKQVGGEIVVPPGQSVVVTAPVAGTITAPPSGTVPNPGARLASGDPVFRLTPLLTPERDVLAPADLVGVAQTRAQLAIAQVEAERQVVSAGIEVERARIAYERAVVLRDTGGGSQRQLDEAQALMKLATEAEQTAIARRELLAGIRLEEEAGELMTRDVNSPLTGVLQSVDAAANQTVAVGAPLFRVARLDPLWVRVPVLVGDWPRVDIGRPVMVTPYGRSADAAPISCAVVAAPPSADPAAATIDLFCELDNDGAEFYPGQRVSATLTLSQPEESLVTAWAAIVYDVHGGTWVYERTAPQTYVRRRVEVRYVDPPRVVLERGPEEGAELVTEGASRLFDIEFGAGK